PGNLGLHRQRDRRCTSEVSRLGVAVGTGAIGDNDVAQVDRVRAFAGCGREPHLPDRLGRLDLVVVVDALGVAFERHALGVLVVAHLGNGRGVLGNLRPEPRHDLQGRQLVRARLPRRRREAHVRIGLDQVLLGLRFCNRSRELLVGQGHEANLKLMRSTVREDTATVRSNGLISGFAGCTEMNAVMVVLVMVTSTVTESTRSSFWHSVWMSCVSWYFVTPLRFTYARKSVP